MPNRDTSALDPIFQAAAEQYGLDPALLKAHAYVESRFNPDAVSPQGAIGIMQMLPATAKAMGADDPRDPAQAIPAAAKYLAEGFDKTGNAQDAVMYYHGGPDRNGWGPKTHAYLDQVAQAYDHFSREAAQNKATSKAGNSASAAPDLTADELYKLYGSKPEASGGGNAPAGDALTIRVKPNNVGPSADELYKQYSVSPEALAAEKAAVVPGDEAAAVGRAIVDGVPVIGPYLTTGLNAGVAGIRSLQSGKPFKEEYKNAKDFGLATAEANPGSTMAGNVLGAVAGTGGLLGAAARLPGIGASLAEGGNMLLGINGTRATEGALAAARAAQAANGTAETAAALNSAKNTNMLARIAMGAPGGAAVGAADAAVRGDDVRNGALTGGLFGAAAPVAGRALGATLGPVSNKLMEAYSGRFNPETRANNSLMRMIGRDDQTLPELRAEFQRNPNLSFADLNESMKSSVLKLAQSDGPEAPALRAFARSRRAAGGDMMRAAQTEALGAPVDPVSLREQLVQTAKTNAAKGFGEALRGADPVDLAGLSPATLAKLAEVHADVMNRLPNGAPVRGGDKSAILANAVREAEARAMARGADTATPGVGNSVFTPSGREVGVKYRVVEADSPTASHGADMVPNPQYPAEMQPRDRTRAASEAQISRMAGELQPQRLGASTSAMEGAPIIGHDGVVESGNGRVLAIRKAYQQGGEAAAKYRQFLADQGHDVAGMKRPMLVRERTTDMTPAERVRFAQEANASAGLSASASERAATDARRLSPDVLNLYQGGDVASSANRPFVREFLRTVADKGEEGAFVSRDGTLSMEGAQRVRNALLHSAYNDSGVVSALAESGDEGLRAFGKVLSETSGKMAQLRHGIVSGDIHPHADLTGPTLEAAKFVQTARNRGMPLAAAAAQQDAFSHISPEAMAILKQGYGEDLSGRLAGAHLSDYLSRAADEAAQQTTGARLFGEPLTAREILGRTQAKAGADHVGDAPAVAPAAPAPAAAEPTTRARGSILEPSALKRFDVTDANELHLVQSELRQRISDMEKSPDPVHRIAARQLSDMRAQLNERINDATGGKFKPAQKQFADDISVREHFDEGLNSLDRVRGGPKGLEQRPEALARDWANMAPAERDAYRQGMRTQIQNLVQNARNPARAAEAVTDPGFNRQKMEIVFGKREAAQLLRAVEDSRRMATTNALIDSGSKTGAALLGGQEVGFEPGAGGANAIDAGVTAMTALGAGIPALVGKYGLQAGKMGLASKKLAADVGRNRLLAAAAMAHGPEGEAVVNKLEQFLATRAANKAGVGSQIEKYAPLQLMIRAGARPVNQLLNQ